MGVMAYYMISKGRFPFVLDEELDEDLEDLKRKVLEQEPDYDQL